MDYEIRSTVTPIEFKSNGPGKIVASGVAMAYRSKSRVIEGLFREQFEPGSFTKTLKEQDIRSHNEHEGPYLARSAVGSLRLTDSSTELSYELDLPDTTAGRDAAVLLERGDIAGCSIGFRSIPASEQWSDDGGVQLRTIKEARLFRVDLTTAPAYVSSTAGIAVRSMVDHYGLDPEGIVDISNLEELRSLIEKHREGGAPDSRKDSTVERERISWMY